MWVMQLELEMLAAPAQSALLVSRSASNVSMISSACYDTLHEPQPQLLKADRAAGQPHPTFVGLVLEWFVAFQPALADARSIH